MNTETGEIRNLTKEDVAAMPPHERRKWVDLGNAFGLELFNVIRRGPADRLDWLGKNRYKVDKLAEQMTPKQARSFIGKLVVGATRAQLRSAGVRLRPHQAKVLAGRFG